MSEPHDRVEIVQKGMDAYARGDMPAVLSLFHEDLELYSPPELGNSPADLHGREGYLEWLNAWLEAWEEYRVEIVRIDTVGDRHVVAHCRQHAVGRGSGIEVDFQTAYLWEIHDGRACAFHLYRTWDEAVDVAQRREADSGSGSSDA